MPKKIEGYECLHCSSLYEQEHQARDCENNHPNVSKMEIIRAAFSKLQGTYGMERGHVQRYPKKITVRFSENHGDFASYSLSHVGYKGV